MLASRPQCRLDRDVVTSHPGRHSSLSSAEDRGEDAAQIWEILSVDERRALRLIDDLRRAGAPAARAGDVRARWLHREIPTIQAVEIWLRRLCQMRLCDFVPSVPGWQIGRLGQAAIRVDEQLRRARGGGDRAKRVDEVVDDRTGRDAIAWMLREQGAACGSIALGLGVSAEATRKMSQRYGRVLAGRSARGVAGTDPDLHARLRRAGAILYPDGPRRSERRTRRDVVGDGRDEGTSEFAPRADSDARPWWEDLGAIFPGDRASARRRG